MRSLLSTIAITGALLTITAQAQFTGTTQIGGGALGSIATNGPGSYTVIGGGNDIWDVSDEFTFHYFPVTGDFDIRARMESLQPTARWSKAGIMARESVNGDSRMAFVKGSPADVLTGNGGNGVADVSFMYRTWIADAGSNGGQHEDRIGGVAYYPAYNWLRLQRVGNVMRAYASTDGLTWVGPNEQDTAAWLSPAQALASSSDWS